MVRMLVIGAVLVLMTGCPKNEDECQSTSDCGESQVCENGTCENLSTECTGDPDCPGGFVCQDATCVRPDIDPMDMGTDDGDPPDQNFRDVPNDDIPPTVVSIDPDDGSTDVALLPTITIELSEPPQPTTINFQSVLLKDPANADVPATVMHDPGTTTITLTPDAALLPASGYRVEVTENVRDMAFNQLERTTSTFTTIYDEPAEITALALQYAPVVYQALATDSPGARNLDFPTRIDWDGNQRAAGNLASGEVAAIQTTAAVYYNVLRTETHDFVSYILYYIGREINGERHEHDFTGVTFVIDRATGNFKVAEGIKVQETGADTIIGFKPSNSDTDGNQQPQNLYTFDSATFEGDRYPLYIPPLQHEACNFFREGPTIPVICRHNVGEFPNDDNALGLVMRPGVGQRINEGVADAQGRRELTYELVPFVSTIWASRSFVGPDAMWQSSNLYRPIGDRPGSLDLGPMVIMPTTLSADTAITYGKSPFRWFPSAGQMNHGQWFIDPAHILPMRYDFQETFSDIYCFNPFLGINRSGDPLCPN